MAKPPRKRGAPVLDAGVLGRAFVDIQPDAGDAVTGACMPVDAADLRALGANALLGVSLAVARAAASSADLPLLPRPPHRRSGRSSCRP